MTSSVARPKMRVVVDTSCFYFRKSCKYHVTSCPGLVTSRHSSRVIEAVFWLADSGMNWPLGGVAPYLAPILSATRWWQSSLGDRTRKMFFLVWTSVWIFLLMYSLNRAAPGHMESSFSQLVSTFSFSSSKPPSLVTGVVYWIAWMVELVRNGLIHFPRNFG